MIAAVGGVLYFLGIKDQPYAFTGFFAMFMILFFATGVGNASTFQMIPAIMRAEMPRLEPKLNATDRVRQADMESAAIIGFTSAVAAYGAFFIPKSYGSSIAITGGPEMALWGFMVFYVTCVLVTWFYYTRRGGLLRDIERGGPRFLPPRSRRSKESIMSHFLDRLTFFKRVVDDFSDGHGIVTNEDRRWEDGYRKRWQHDKIVRSTHGANCTGSCSWKIYVKGGIVTWETQQTDYPRTRPDLPNHEPRGCSRGASYSWYLYSGNRVKYPLVRSRLLKLWREARRGAHAGGGLGLDRRGSAKARGLYHQARTWRFRPRRLGRGNRDRRGRQCLYRQEARPRPRHRLLADSRRCRWCPMRPARAICRCSAASACRSTTGIATCRRRRRRPGASRPTFPKAPTGTIPASSSCGVRTFRRPARPTRISTPRRATAVPRAWSSAPDYSEASKFADLWISVKQGTDSALAMAMGHVILREFHVDRQAKYFADYARQYTDMPFLVRLVKTDGRLVPERLVRASDFAGNLNEANNPEWKTVAIDEASGEIVVPNGSVGFRWGEKGKWNLEEKDSSGRETKLRLSLDDVKDELADVAFPYFGNREHDHFAGTDHPSVLMRKVPAKRVTLKDGEALVASVYDLFLANYGVDRGFGGEHVAKSYDENVPYTPAWAEKISGVPRDQIITVAREFALNAEKTKGRSMVIIGAAMNHWYHCDMNYRGVINMLVMCGCVGQSGGGWSHYVGQEKLRPQSGWLPLAFALDWSRPPRQQNSTSFFYAHTDQWRYETLGVDEIISPTAPPGPWDGALIDYNVRAERMGWLPSAPQLRQNPLAVAKAAAAAGLEAKDYVAKALKSGELQMSCEDPDHPDNWPRNMFVWRSNLLGLVRQGA